MDTQPICQECGTQLPGDDTERQCPKCLMEAALRTDTGSLPDGRADNAPDPAEIAAQFPKLEIIEFLGQGGMGMVYRARQPDLDRDVALKILTPAPAQRAAFTERFLQEARVLARLNHPHIVAVYDSGRTESGLCYLIMEFVDGADLRRVVQSGELQAHDALAIVPQICDALQYAHDLGVVHRDIKPENILLDREGRVKIADFGIAKILRREAAGPGLTGSQQVVGTPRYMAPEQIQTPHDVDHRADIYSLGVVFYEMLTGEPPMGRFAPPSQKVRIDVRLDDVVLKTLDREPDRRYQHASEVRTAVETIQNDGQESTVIVTPTTRHGNQSATGTRSGNRGPLVVLLLAALVVFFMVGLAMVVVVSVWMYYGRSVAHVGTADHPRGVDMMELENWGANLVLNPGFEDATTPGSTEAAYWISAPTSAAQEPPADCQRITQGQAQGGACVSVVKAHSEFHAAEAGFMQNLTQLPHGERVRVSGMIRTANVNGSASIKLRLMDAEGKSLGMCALPLIKGTTAWQRHAATTTIPPGAVGVLALVLQGTGEVWFDDVQVQVLAGSKAVTPRPGAASGVNSALEPDADFVANGGFEEISGGYPKAWLAVGQGVSGLAMEVDLETKRSGVGAAVIRNTAADTQQPWNWRQEITSSSVHGLPVGQTVELSGWVATKNATHAMVGVQVQDSDRQMLAFHTTQTTQPFSGTSDWKQFTLRFPVPMRTGHIAILAMHQGRGEVWFDDFRLVLVTPGG